MLRDTRYAFRSLRKNPGFTATCVVTLALAIGANTAMFSVLNWTLFQPLPYRSPERLAMLWTERPNQNVREGRSAYWNIEQWRSQSKSFTDMAFFDGASGTLTSQNSAEKISLARISPNFFSLLGMQLLLGRTFSSEEAQQRQRLVLISYRFWQTRFGGLPDALGTSIELDGLPYRIIGVVPEAFPAFLADTDVWQPHTMVPNWDVLRQIRGSGFWAVMGRLEPNVTVKQAQAEMTGIARRLDAQLPASDHNLGISLVPLSLQVTGPRARLTLWMLMGAIFCVLLIAAANSAGLSLARGADREKEIAIRAALGASPARIMRQLLVESVALAVVSGTLGLLVAWAGIRIILILRPPALARLNEVSLDPRALACCLALCLVTGISIGLAPAVAAVRRNLKSSGQHGGRRALVVAEFALAIVLLVGAGLLIRSMWFVQNVDPGFGVERVLSVQLALPAAMPVTQRAGVYDGMRKKIESLPGIARAGIIENFFIGGNPEQMVTIEGNRRAVSQHVRFRSDSVSEGFFQALNTPLLRGRFFSAEDRLHSQRVVILNEVMARHLWPDRDPIGGRFKLGAEGSTDSWYTVVGLVGNMRRAGLENEPVPQMFTPLAQDPPRLATLLVRTSIDDPLKMAGAVEVAVHRVQKYTPVYGVTTLENQLGGFLATRRFQTLLLIGFSAIALLMAAIGIYGLIQYSVAARTREIGIRIAVGAETGEIFRMVIREGLRMSLTGLALGLIAALYVSRAGASLLFGVTPADPATFLSVSLVLVVVTLAACYLPARRAMKVEPLTALRQE